MIEWTVASAEEGRRVRNFLMKHLPDASASLIYKALRQKDVRVNGKHVKGDEILCGGDQVVLYLSEERAVSLGFGKSQKPERSEEELHSHVPDVFSQVSVIYEDEEVLVMNKPQNVLVQKARETDYSLTEYLKDRYTDKDGFIPAPVNRLDRNTSGVVIAGRSVRSLQALNEMMRSHSGKKEYLAAVEGVGIGRKPIYLVHRWQKDTQRNKVTVERIYLGPEKPSEDRMTPDTVCCRMKLLTENKTLGCSLLLMELLTGKSHQLRSQLEDIGHPILGDPKYASGSSVRLSAVPFSGQMLHAWRYRAGGLSGGLSYLNDKIWTAEPPKSLKKALERFFPGWETICRKE